MNGISHLDVQEDLEKLAAQASLSGIDSDAYHKQRELFLSFHYHHGPAELDLTVPRWGEKKEWVDDLIKGFKPSSKKSASSFDQTVHRLESGAGRVAKARFKSSLERSRSFLKMREEVRCYSTRAY